MSKVFILISGILLSSMFCLSLAQTKSNSLIQQGTLQNCVQYALRHQLTIQQSLLDEEIADRIIKGKLADWYPQLNLNFNLIHNYQLPTSIFQGNAVHLGIRNTSSLQFSATQTIFDRDVLLASRSAKDVREQAANRTINNKIDVVVNVSKAFYSVLLSQAQIQLLNEDITRLELSQKDTYNQYKGGVVDKTDYTRASIALNNARAEKRQSEENLTARFAFLKEQMGYPSRADLQLQFDSAKMENDAFIDTAQTVNFDSRIEYRLLETQYRLQEANLSYNKWSFIPTLSAFGNYNINYLNDVFSRLYNQSYPNSLIGLQLSFPIFDGGKRFYEISQANYELQRSEYDIQLLKNSINTQYAQALANYKSNLNNYYVLKENLNLAKDVYNTIQLQYKAGIKTYLEIITAETDLRTTQLNYINALYEVLSSKLDVQKALGIVQY